MFFCTQSGYVIERAGLSDAVFFLMKKRIFECAGLPRVGGRAAAVGDVTIDERRERRAAAPRRVAFCPDSYARREERDRGTAQ